jgi:hypothetical protein
MTQLTLDRTLERSAESVRGQLPLALAAYNTTHGAVPR